MSPRNRGDFWLRTYGEARALALHEHGSAPSERILQLIWQHQRLRRGHLKLMDGRPLRVLHPGFHNHESGPDFQHAIIQTGEDPPVSGDIELDLHSGGWRQHQHDRNPAFDGVILHVIWAGHPHPTLPTLELASHLDSPVRDLALWLNTESPLPRANLLAGQCAAPLAGLTEDQLLHLLRDAALVRLEGKGRAFQARARESGWGQALWEGLFRALGYKHNVWPMQHLAECRPRLVPDPPGTSKPANASVIQARLLGTAGLLPRELTRRSASTDAYLRVLWDQWWRDHDFLASWILPCSAWRYHGVRPANHPERRLALAAHWMADDHFVSRLEQWGVKESSPAHPARELLQILQPPTDPFWAWHWSLRSPRLPKQHPLLGISRVTDLAMNVVLPWLWIRAREGSGRQLQETLETTYLAWPSGQDNAVLKLARTRLLGERPAKVSLNAAAQQGMLQIVRDFCAFSNALCDQCKFPTLISQWKTRG